MTRHGYVRTLRHGDGACLTCGYPLTATTYAGDARHTGMPDADTDTAYAIRRAERADTDSVNPFVLRARAGMLPGKVLA